MTLRRQAWVFAAAVAVAVVAACLASVAPRSAGAAAGTPALTIAVDPVGGSAGEVTYRIVVANRGSATASGVAISNPVPTAPSGVTFKQSSPPPSAATTGGPSCAPGSAPPAECRWSIGDLPAGGTATVDVTFGLPPVTSGTGEEKVETTATATAAGDLDASNEDESFRRQGSFFLHDTYVDDTAPADTYNGGCPELQVRRNNSMTAFIRTFTREPDFFPQEIDRVFRAELRATVKTGAAAAPSTQLGLHPIQDGDWQSSSGECNTPHAGLIRTGATPPSAVEPSSVAPFSGVAGAPVVWDVTGDFDTDTDRFNHLGWEVIDEGTVPPDAVSSLESRESASPPYLVLAWTTFEPPTCIEISPATQTRASAEEALASARLTDGSEAQDAAFCNGAPIPRERIEFTVTDDEPDVYLSSANGKPAAFSSNRGLATIDPATGVATVGLRLMSPEYGEGGDLGEVAVTANWAQNCSPTFSYANPSPGPGGCSGGPVTAPFEPISSSFSAQWVRGPAPPTPPPPPPPPPPEEGGEPADIAGPPDAAAPEQLPQPRSISAATSRSRVVWAHVVTISGRLASPAQDCLADQRVQLWRQYPGAGWTVVGARRTGPGGSFAIKTLVTRFARYLAVADGTPQCLGESSEPMEVRSRPLVELKATHFERRYGAKLTLFGRVTPRAGRRVILERKRGKTWRRVARPRLTSKSRYRYVSRAKWEGTRKFRVRSRAGNGQDSAVSRTIAITVERP